MINFIHHLQRTSILDLVTFGVCPRYEETRRKLSNKEIRNFYQEANKETELEKACYSLEMKNDQGYEGDIR